MAHVTSFLQSLLSDLRKLTVIQLLRTITYMLILLFKLGIFALFVLFVGAFVLALYLAKRLANSRFPNNKVQAWTEFLRICTGLKIFEQRRP